MTQGQSLAEASTGTETARTGSRSTTTRQLSTRRWQRNRIVSRLFWVPTWSAELLGSNTHPTFVQLASNFAVRPKC